MINIRSFKIQLSVDEKNDLKKRMKAFREVYEKNEPLIEFDRHVFESVVEEIILGKVDEHGNKKSYFITFIFRTGFKMEADGETKKSKAKGSKSKSNDENVCSYSAYDTRGERSIDNKSKRLRELKTLIYQGF